jgi:hypothetical protein
VKKVTQEGGVTIVSYSGADLQQFKDQLSRYACGMTVAEAHAKGICIECKEPALPKCYSEAGRGEYQISGTCEKCFDAMFAEEDE